MNTLLLRLTSPLQSWGVQSRFGERDTGREPSKSGVVGLLCAALGRPRSASLDDLASLRMGVRVDREGSLSSEFQTIQAVEIDGQERLPGISRRFYLAGAVFLVGLESADLLLLERLHLALRQPRWVLYLGRRAFPPSAPIWLPDGLRPGLALEEALRSYPWLCAESPASPLPQRLRLILDDPLGDQLRPDYPLSFAERRFAPRRVSTRFIPPPPSETTAEPEVT